MGYVICYNKPISEFNIPCEDEKYLSLGRQEINAWLNQLRRTFPFTKFELQDIGEKDKPFWTAIVPYDDSNEQDMIRAFNVVEEVPYCWDDKAREELGKEYFDYIRRLICPQDFSEKKPDQEDNKNTKE